MEGRSISRVNGETVPMSVLKNVASILIDIHGQHEHQTLLNTKNHQSILDDYIGMEASTIKSELAIVYSAYKEKLKEYEQADLDVESRNREIAFLEFEFNEIDDANLQLGEDEELETSYKRMINGKKILEHVEEAYQYTGGGNSGNASDIISQAVYAMQTVKSYDETIANYFDQLVEIDSLLNDFNRELVDYRDSLEFSEEEFYEVEERLNLWNHLKSKYGKTYDDIMEYYSEIEGKLNKLNDYDQYLVGLQKEINQLENSMNAVAKQLSNCRKKHAKVFSKEIKLQLQELNFLDIQFEVTVGKKEVTKADGCDQVVFMVSMNPGEAVKSLSNVVSGGELSRIMLAIKTVMADKEQIETVIFDEVDAGISGKTATKVGEKLAIIGKCRQVICITHLAQIASLATEHYIIEKEVVKGITKTEIKHLNHEESIQELTRILGGGTVSEAILQSAIEMKQLAKLI